MIIANFVGHIVVEILESDYCIERVISGVFSHKTSQPFPFKNKETFSNSRNESNGWLHKRARLLDKWRLA